MDYVYGCSDCHHECERSHSMRLCDTIVVTCERCGTKMHRIPQGAQKIEGYYAIHDEPVWYSNLAQKMPFGKKDPKAWFSTRRKAEDYAKKMADTYGGQVQKMG